MDTTFIFSIDNHEFEVLTTDFVPIHPYNVSHIAIGIGKLLFRGREGLEANPTYFSGQRYQIVLNAVPTDRNGTEPLDDNGNYWIRNIPADGCKGFDTGNEPDERQGILRYNPSSKALPTTFRSGFSLACRDEKYNLTVPIVPWNITLPSDGRIRKCSLLSQVEMLTVKAADDEYNVGLQRAPGKPLPGDNFFRWSIGANPMWLNFSAPTILSIPSETWPADHVVVTEDYKEDQWIFLAITATAPSSLPGNNRIFPPASHPVSASTPEWIMISYFLDPSPRPRFRHSGPKQHYLQSKNSQSNSE